MRTTTTSLLSIGAAIATVLTMQPASAQVMAYSDPAASRYPASVFAPFAPARQAYAYAPAQQQPYEATVAEPAESAASVPQHLRRQVVNYPTREAPGTIVVDTPNTYLYYVLGSGQAMRYGIGVGRDGFTWSGVKSVERKAEWPDWHPPQEMIERQPYLPRFMAGGEGNPLGARAMYIGGTIYRIHGTNAPSSIGQNVSSGCIRLLNEDVTDLYERVRVGTKVVVLPAGPRNVPAMSEQHQRLPQQTIATTRVNRIY